MRISSNSFSRTDFNPSSTAWSEDQVDVASGSFSRVSKTLGGQGWDGPNVTSDEFGFDNPDGAAFGVNEFGGIRHFKNRTQPDIDHS